MRTFPVATKLANVKRVLKQLAKRRRKIVLVIGTYLDVRSHITVRLSTFLLTEHQVPNPTHAHRAEVKNHENNNSIDKIQEIQFFLASPRGYAVRGWRVEFGNLT